MSQPHNGDRVWVVYEDDTHHPATYISRSVMPGLHRVQHETGESFLWSGRNIEDQNGNRLDGQRLY